MDARPIHGIDTCNLNRLSADPELEEDTQKIQTHSTIDATCKYDYHDEQALGAPGLPGDRASLQTGTVSHNTSNKPVRKQIRALGVKLATTAVATFLTALRHGARRAPTPHGLATTPIRDVSSAQTNAPIVCQRRDIPNSNVPPHTQQSPSTPSPSNKSPLHQPPHQTKPTESFPLGVRRGAVTTGPTKRGGG